MEALESKIDYKFSNPLLLAEALTHPSLAYETQGPHFDNQRLEFLGDAVLQLCLTRELFLSYPKLDEGSMTKLRAQLVAKPALLKYASRLGLGAYLLMGKGEDASGGRDRASTLADAFEALVGAIYLDSDLATVAHFVLRVCQEELSAIEDDPDQANPKGRLQEMLQMAGKGAPKYIILSQEGPDHKKSFEAKVECDGVELGRGAGASKKEAQTKAARLALLSDFIISLSSSNKEEKRSKERTSEPPLEIENMVAKMRPTSATPTGTAQLKD